MENFATFANWLAVLGVPSVFALFTVCIKYIHKTYKSLMILHNAQKAQMRKELMDQYDVLMRSDSIDRLYYDEWENQYNAYMDLVGKNGVLEDRHQRLMEKYNKR